MLTSARSQNARASQDKSEELQRTGSMKSFSTKNFFITHYILKT